MKKLISVIMSVILIALSLCSGFTAFAAPLQEERESKELNSFINGITELVREYDADKKFTVPENDETAQIQTFSAESTTDSSNPKYTLHDFQTSRLIVRANGKFNKHGALEDISGFEDFHILQYESPEAAMEAYAELQSEKNITNVAPDEVVAPLQGEKVETLTASEISEKDYLCDWSVDRTQSKRLQEYLAQSDISMKDVTVGVVDDGVHYDNEFVRDRIERTNFNSSQSGTANDEYGSPDGHGTAVCSIIADNTPSNVKIKCYKVIDDDGFSPITHVFAGYIAAVNDGVDVISVSLAYYDDTDLTESFVRIAYKNNIPVFGGMGNDGRLDYNLVPANVPECIAVSATDDNNTVTLWTTFSDGADISAPGQSICVAMGANEYDIWSGTSFSTPCAAALGAILKAQNPDITVDKLEERIKSTSSDVKRYNDCESWRDYEENMYGSFTDNYYSLFDGVGMVQFSDAFGLPELAMPEYNLKDALYINAQKCSITCKDKNATILYTTDGTYPALENAYKYTEPFDVTQRTRIRAVAYYADSGYYSREVEITPRIQYMDSDDAYTITDNGIITNYSGSVSDLYIQDEINNIEVKGIAKGAFDNSELIGLTLPDSVTEISESAFYNNDSLEFIRGVGVEYVGTNAFANSALKYAEFPNAKEIANLSFKQTKHFCKGDFSKLEKIGTRAFQRSNIISFNGPEVKEIEQGVFEECLRLEVVRIPKCKKYISKLSGYNGDFYSDKYLLIAEMPLIENLLRGALEDTCIKEANYPFLKEMQKRAFYNCTNLKVINTPMLKVVPENAFNGTLVNIGNTVPRIYYLDSVTQIEQDAFGEYPTSRIEFSHLETAQSLPQTEGCIIAMPSTFSECTEDTNGRNYKVYGTSGTYAEAWANENGHEFIEISQDTAILKDVPMEYTDETQTLSPDVIGFNRTYQWYASDKPDNTAGTPINGATDREFNPADYPAAKYYYCVVTSTDVGYDPIEIRTGVTENTTLNLADYSKVEKAKSEIPEDLSVYTDESVKALQDILDNIDYSLDETEQSRVDDYAEAIENAINALEYKPADYTEYNKAVERANALDRSLYKDLTALDEALNVDVSGKNITEQTVVNEQTQAILEAIEKLEYKEADYTEYNKAVENANDLDRSLYQDLTALDEALKTDVSGKNITEQTVVDEQTKSIEEAINALEYKPADYTEYNKAVEKANALDRSLYQDLTALDEALKTDVSGKNITEQSVVDEQTKAIEEAINSLEYKPADYTEYNKAVEKANDLDRNLYQDLTALDNALSVDVSGKNITEQAVVDEQTKAIEEAINSLEYKPADYTEYNKAVEKANALDRSLYQDLTALDEALKTDVSGKNITEQAVVDEQTKAIEEAIYSLEYKPADYSKLNSALAQVPEDLSIYTDESVKQLNSVIESLNYDLNITEQDKADKQVEALLEAIGALEKRYILGDVNLDGEITILDAKWVLQNIVRLRSLDGLSLKAADMNQDGKITILDARLILFAVTR